MIIFNLSNQIGAGPQNISMALLRVASASEVPTYFVVNDVLRRFIVDNDLDVRYFSVGGVRRFGALFTILVVSFIIMPIVTLRYGAIGVVSFGNFLLRNSARSRSAVLMHHPYLVDDALYANLEITQKIPEFFKRVLFRRTISVVNCVVVQTQAMAKLTLEKYPWVATKLRIIPNPISPVVALARGAAVRTLPDAGDTIRVIYPSRFYPHKNHVFLIDFLKSLRELYPALYSRVEVVITVDAEIPGVSDLLFQVRTDNVNIVNIGEVGQDKLVEWYARSHVMMFPSRSETFGNPIIEAAGLGLPVMLPRLEFATAIFGSLGRYYNSVSAVDAAVEFNNLVSDQEEYRRAVDASLAVGSKLLSPEEWFGCYVGLVYES